MNELVQNYVIRANLLLFANFIGCSSTSSLCKHDAKKCPGPYWYGKWHLKKSLIAFWKNLFVKITHVEFSQAKKKEPFEV